MKIIRMFFILIMTLISAQIHAIVPLSSIVWLRDYAKQHPALTVAVAAAALLGLSYTYVQIISRNKPVQVKLVEFKSKAFKPCNQNFLFAAGIAETHEQAWWYTKKTDDLPDYRYQADNLPYTMDGRIFTYDYPDTTHWFWRVNWMQTGLGQKNEVEGFKNAFDKAIAQIHAPENKDFNLNGMSRGATTILNFMGKYGNDSKYASRIKSLVVESPFASTKDLATNMLGYFNQIPGASTLAHSLVSVAFWQHDTAGEQAIDTVENIPLDVPIMLICSKEDKVVPASSTIALYKKLRATGHDKVHIFIAEYGIHGRILHGADGVRYQNVVQSFYKKYGLHHDDALAELGYHDFQLSQPEL